MKSVGKGGFMRIHRICVKMHRDVMIFVSILCCCTSSSESEPDEGITVRPKDVVVALLFSVVDALLTLPSFP